MINYMVTIAMNNGYSHDQFTLICMWHLTIFQNSHLDKVLGHAIHHKTTYLNPPCLLVLKISWNQNQQSKNNLNIVKNAMQSQFTNTQLWTLACFLLKMNHIWNSIPGEWPLLLFSNFGWICQWTKPLTIDTDREVVFGLHLLLLESCDLRHVFFICQS